jgi:hypothetical protein
MFQRQQQQQQQQNIESWKKGLFKEVDERRIEKGQF